MSDFFCRVRMQDNGDFIGCGKRLPCPDHAEPAPVPMILYYPKCNSRHIDRGEFATKPHHTHACQRCGLCWRPAVVPTVGVGFLPGFKDDDSQREVVPPKETP